MDRDLSILTAEDLLEHAEWMRRLARALVRDPSDADDLAQEVWEAALEKPPREPGPVRPWLAGVARNLARMRSRSAGRRERREHAAGHEDHGGAVPTPDELVERAEAQQLVARFVLELPEELRTVLLLRYGEGQSSTEIGAHLELAPGTVRWRLKRGLDELRVRLDREHQGGSRRWRALLAPFAMPAMNAPGGAGLSTAKGVLAMKLTLKIAAAIAVLIAALFGSRMVGLWGSSNEDEREAEAAQPIEAAAKSAVVAPVASFTSREAMRATRQDDPRGSLRMEGQVVDEDELPVPGALVAIDSHPPRTVVAEGDGSFWFDGLIGRTYSVEARAGNAYAGPVQLRLTATSEPVILRARPAGVVEVEVRDAVTGEPIAGAQVELRSALVWQASSGDDGIAVLRGVGMGFLPLRVTAKGYAPAGSMLLTTGDPERPQRQRLSLRRGAPVSGVVVDPRGEPIAGAQVVARAASEPFPVIDPLRDGVRSDAKGRWRIDAVGAGTHRFTATHEDFAAGSTTQVTLDGTQPLADVRIEMIEGGVIAGEVKTAAGDPVAGAVVRAVASGSVTWRAQREAFTDADGRFRITELPRRRIDVIASHPAGSSPVVSVNLAAEPSGELSLVLSVEGAIAGVVVDSAGEPIAQAHVVVEPVWSGARDERQTWAVRGLQSTLAGAGGEFELGGLPPGAYRLRAARPGASEAALWLSAGMVAESGMRDVRLVLPDDGLVRGRVLFSDGEAPELFTIAVGETPPVAFGGDDGRFEIVAPGGTYNLAVAGPDFVRELIEVRVDDDGEDLGTITVERGRSVSGRVLDASGAAVAGATVAAGGLLTGDGSELYIETESVGARDTTTDDDGRFLFSGLRPGSLVIVGGKPGVGRSSSIAIPAGGGSVELDLLLQPTGSLEGVATKDGQPLAEVVVIAQPVGATASNFFTLTGPDGSFALDTLTVGDYILEVMTGADLFMRQVAIVAGERAKVEIAVISGPVTLSIEARTDEGQAVPAAKVRILGFEADAATVNGLRHGTWAAQHDFGDDVVPFFRRNAHGEPTRFEDLLPGRYTACVQPLPVDPADRQAMERLRERMAELPNRCEPVRVDASPAEQRMMVTVPASWIRP